MIQVQQQSFPAIEESEAEKIVVDEREHRPQDDVDETEPHFPFGDHHLCPERRVAVHVLDVVGECGVGMVYEVNFRVTLPCPMQRWIEMVRSWF